MTGVYYSDLFVINGSGCLVMGFGKSKACRYYTGNNTIEICLDGIRLEYKDNKLFGYADPTLGIYPFNKKMAKNTQIKYLIRMLNAEETSKLGCNSIIEINKDDYIKLCDFNISFGVPNEEERRMEFKKLIKDVDLKCIIVPWCKDMQTKGNLIADYIK